MLIIVLFCIQFLNYSAYFWSFLYRNKHCLVSLRLLKFHRCKRNKNLRTVHRWATVETYTPERKYSKRGNGLGATKLYLTDPCRIVKCQYHGWGMPGQRAGSPIALYAQVQYKPRAQNRAGKGLILLWRRYNFPILLLFMYDILVHPSFF